MTAMAATVGVGNIVGVATAVYFGGPGAVFWMWMAGFFGMATKYGEAILAVKYRVKDANGQMSGGPMYYLEHGLKRNGLACSSQYLVQLQLWYRKWNTSQSRCGCYVFNVLISTLEHRNCTCYLCGLVILGGIKTIGKVNCLFRSNHGSFLFHCRCDRHGYEHYFSSGSFRNNFQIRIYR